MAGDFFVFFALGALLLFVLWEMWRGRPDALQRRVRGSEGFTPGGSANEVALFVLASVFLICSGLVIAYPEWVASGRQADLFNWLMAQWGPYAPGVLFFAVAAAAFTLGVTVRRRRLTGLGAAPANTTVRSQNH